MSSDYTAMSMLRLCSLDPPKYGWTACGGVASILEPHEMARRPEAKEKFLKRRREEKASAAALSAAEGSTGDDAAVAESAAAATSPTYYTINDPSDETIVPPSAFTTPIADGAATPPATAAENTPLTIAVDSSTTTDDNKNNSKKSSTKKISIHSTVTKGDEDCLDIYTYHRGRVGQEPRDPKSGELLCDTDLIDTNHHWIPPDTTVKIRIDFPLGDPNEEEYVDSDLEDDSDDGMGKSGGKELSPSMGSLDRSDSNVGLVRASRSRATRAGSVDGPSPSAPSGDTQQKQQPSNLLPRFVQVIDWNLSNPRAPSPEEYAAQIASEFGLSFPQTMDLKESIERQLNAFVYERNYHRLFRAPIALVDPYGAERPEVQFGPMEAHFGPVLGVPNVGMCMAVGIGSVGTSGEDGISLKTSNGRRSNSGVSSSTKRSSANSANAGNSSGLPSSARSARGAIKPDRRGINVVPPDEVPRHDVTGDIYRAEVLKRAKARSCRMVREAVGRGEEVLTTVHNEVCHICHNRKELGLTFHCGRHVYCDSHCASRLSFRAGDYDSKNPTNIPVDFCPICTLTCTCAKCTRRLEDVSRKMKIACQAQNCGPEEVVMENLYDLCSTKLKVVCDKTGNAKKKGSGRKVRIEDSSPAAAVTGGKRGRSDEEGGSAQLPRQSTSRSTRSSPPTEDTNDDTASRRKKRKTSEPAVPVPVLKVPPSDFPKEMYGTKDLDPSAPEDMNTVFTPDGSFPVGSPNAFPVDSSKQKYQEKIKMKATEGNFFQCAVCNRENGDEFICCKKCPRAYHKKCFEDFALPSSDNVCSSGARQRRECKRCEWDCQIRPEEDIVSGQMKVDKKILSAYGKYKGHGYMSMMIGELLQILEKLKRYDYGEIFATPVDATNIPDYLITIRKPMDYGTIASNLEKGHYSPHSSDSPSSSENNMDAMEDIVLQALIDIEQVHHNCFLYNEKETPYYRAGEVQATKWKAYYTKHIKERLPDTVQSSLAAFQKSCGAERRAKGSPGRKINVLTDNNVRSKPLAVFDPNTKRIVKQYSSKTAARTAALMLYDAGYACEWPLSQSNITFRIAGAEDPTKCLFGYQWVPTEKLKRGNFKVKTYFRNDHLEPPTSNNVVILKEDTVSGTKLRGFESEESAYNDWADEMRGSFNARVDQEEEDPGSGNTLNQSSEFVRNYLDGGKSINGIVWKRVDHPNDDVVSVALTPRSPVGKVVMEHTALSSARKGKSEENALD